MHGYAIAPVRLEAEILRKNNLMKLTSRSTPFAIIPGTSYPSIGTFYPSIGTFDPSTPPTPPTMLVECTPQ